MSSDARIRLDEEQWLSLRTFLRDEVRQEVRTQVDAMDAKLGAVVTRVATLEADVKSVGTGVSQARWEISNLAGMLSGFIGTKDVTGKFDVAMDSIRDVADRANALSHEVVNKLQIVSGRMDRFEGVKEGRSSLEEKQAKEKTKRFEIFKWIVGIGGAGFMAAAGWLSRHLHWTSTGK